MSAFLNICIGIGKNRQEDNMITVDDAKKEMKCIFLGSFDLLVREVVAGETKIAFFLIDGLYDKDLYERDILKPLLSAKSFKPPFADALKTTTSFGEQIKEFTDLRELAQKIAEGDIGLVIEGSDTYYLFNLRKYAMRAIAEPPTESVIRGPREGFIEDMKTNISILRRRLKTPNMCVETLQLGKVTHTPIAICHINGIADEKVVCNIKSRLSKIKIDGITDSSMLIKFLEEHKYSIFGEVGYSEKPDIITAKMLEGRVAIIVDGSPVVLTLPFLLFEDMQDSFDYYENEWRASMVRFWRLFGAMLTALLPGAYVALQTYHFHLLPLKFFLTLMAAVNGIPYPPAVEMLIVVVLFEVLNQASIRMPRLLGISLSVVGAIVLGDTAVKAGLISSPAVLVTALSAIGIFCVPNQVASLSFLRFAFLVVSAVLGLFGLIITLAVVIGYLSSLNTYGTPMLAPVAPIIGSDWKDLMLKDSIIGMKKRPKSIPTKNKKRQ